MGIHATVAFNGNGQHIQGVVNPASVLHQQLQVEHPLLHFLDTSTTVSTVIPKEHMQTNHKKQQPIQVTKLGPGSVIKLENADRPFMCGICSRAFIQQSTLTNHLKTHTGEKPYQCKVCEAHFRQLSTLNNHMKIHTGEKPYSCSYCPKQFRQKSTLTNHIRVHTC